MDTVAQRRLRLISNHLPPAAEGPDPPSPPQLLANTTAGRQFVQGDLSF